MEWEFSDSPDGGHFVATTKAVAFLRNHLAKGEIDQALSLYESCAENVGDELMAEFPTASTSSQKAMANLFFRARDYRRAATACEKLGEWEAAGRSYEAAYQYPRAADCYLRAKKLDRAAAVLQKGGQYDKAAELYEKAGKLEASAGALERGGDPYAAAQVSLRANDLRGAARLLASVQPEHSVFYKSVALLADVLYKLGQHDLAAQRLQGALPADGSIPGTDAAEVAYRLGAILAAAGRFQEAIGPLSMVRDYNPEYKDVSARLADATMRTQTGAREPAAAPTFSPAPPSAPPAHDPFAALDGNVFAPKSRHGSAPAARYGSFSNLNPAGGFVTKMSGYDLLKTLPILQDLSLDEMKEFYHLCETISYEPGEVIIAQGQPGPGLFIVREGSLRVLRRDGEREVEVAKLPAGSFVGEISLIDDGPTSAEVQAAERVVTLQIAKDVFQRYVYTRDLVALRIYKAFTSTLVARVRDANDRLANAER